MLTSWLPLLIVGIAGLLIGLALALVIPRLGQPATKPVHQVPSKTLSQRILTQRQKLLHIERLREVYKHLANLSATLSYQRVLDAALNLSMKAMAESDGIEERLVSAVLLFSEEENNKLAELTVAASRGFTRPDLRLTFPAQSGVLKKTIDEGAGFITRNISQDPELGRVIALQSCVAAYCIPLRQGYDTYGALLFAHPEPGFFTAERRELLDIIGNQAMIAIQNARLYQELEQEKERMIEIQDEARKKLARDLHDGPTQSVAAIAMRVNFARRLIERNSKAAAEELYKIEELARRTTKEIRHMLFTLRPLVLESQGLTAALESMAEKMRETYNQNVVLDIDSNIEEELEMGKQGVIFAIVEEAVNNARKYANADHIWVRLKTIQQDLAVLEIQDDGVGFDLDAVDASYENRGSLGLINMRERTELVNGIIHVESAIGKGTCIQVVIPLTEEAIDRLQRGG